MTLQNIHPWCNVSYSNNFIRARYLSISEMCITRITSIVNTIHSVYNVHSILYTIYIYTL